MQAMVDVLWRAAGSSRERRKATRGEHDGSLNVAASEAPR